MYGFENPNQTNSTMPDLLSSVPDTSDLSRAAIEHLVARGRHLRGAYIAEWSHRILCNWASLWRRPGRLTPKHGH
jgi:hypothetical protein